MSQKTKTESISKVVPTKRLAIVSDKVGNYENHPFFVKKAEAAKATIARVGWPKELVDRAKKS